ncbi:GntT/GntP/DsdX family permease [Spirabiliibacterium falconis]|uniref:GntT/GntP/DsdX family permease n=1 Tax=Spirabiliibacterium falconis TaxID=572023 RepID=UPI001AAD0D0E|nr:gluconate:H+ symporter [Spirabiliibacterium falconis]MBE2894569.1 GntP family permease [Spirabiliibacterium falconis]
MFGLPTSIIGLIIAVLVLLFLVLRTRVHAFIAMLIASAIAGLVGGLNATETLAVISKGFGGTLGSIGIVIGLGVMMGSILEVSGAAEKMAYSFIKFLGKKKEEWALAITGYIVSIPIFVDSAFIILYPVAKALAKNGKRSLLTLSVALAGGLVVTHHTVPPTPGPLGVAGIFGVDIGAMLLLGMGLAVPAVIGIVLYARWLDQKYPNFNQEVFTQEELREKYDAYIQSKENKDLPSLGLSLLPIVLPIALIFLKALVDLFGKQFEGFNESVFYQVIAFLGSPIIALAISVLVSVYALLPRVDKHDTAMCMEEGVKTAGIILLVTGAGGALGAVLRDSGAGPELAEQIAHLPISPILIPFIVSTLVRFIQGSGTVAMITAASISAPILMHIPGINMLLAAQAATMGSLFFGYFNDSLFWVVNRMMGIKDVQKQMIVWSIPTTIAWAIGGVGVILANLLFGQNGSLFDLVFPLGVLAVILIYVKYQNKKLS